MLSILFFKKMHELIITFLKTGGEKGGKFLL